MAPEHGCARPGPPQLVAASLSSLTTTLRARAPYPGLPTPQHHCKAEQAEQQMFLASFSPCHWMSSVHWKTLSKPLDKQVLWDLECQVQVLTLASFTVCCQPVCQTPEDTCSFLFPCLLAHWQGTLKAFGCSFGLPGGPGTCCSFDWSVQSTVLAKQRLILCYPSIYQVPRFTPPWIKNQKTVNS